MSPSPPPRGKRLALFLDGTWNDARDNTNVWRLYGLCAPRGADGVAQPGYYDAGVGTRWSDRFRGGVFGFGLEENIREAYRWLITQFDGAGEAPDGTAKPDDDAVFLFGFSRGAFTARSLGGLIARCGLLWPGSSLSVEQLFDRYRRPDAPRLSQLRAWRHDGVLAERLAPLPGEQRFEAERLLEESRRIRIRFIGVFDTVGSLGVPLANLPGLSSRRMKFHDTVPSTSYDVLRQALAVDERRPDFAPTLWTEPQQPFAPGQRPDTEQRWFPGVHANVGGGYRGDPLAARPLAWMQAEAEKAGLHWRRTTTPLPDLQQTIPDSSAECAFGAYEIVRRPVPRVIGAHPGQQAPMNEVLDAQLFERWRANADYRPLAVEGWARRRGLDPAALRGDHPA